MLLEKDYKENKQAVHNAIGQICAYLRNDIAIAEQENGLDRIVVLVNLKGIPGFTDEFMRITSGSVEYFYSPYSLRDKYSDIEMFIECEQANKYYPFIHMKDVMNIIPNFDLFKEIYLESKNERIFELLEMKRIHEEEVNSILNFSL